MDDSPGTDSICADHLAFRAAVVHVRGAAARLAEDRDRVAARVEALLDRGWQGGAAASYAAGWAEWTRAADAVRQRDRRTGGPRLCAGLTGFVGWRATTRRRPTSRFPQP